MRKRIISLVLVLVMAISAFPIYSIVNAENAEDKPIYVALGDSITAGFGLPGYDFSSFANLESNIKGSVEDGYVKIVGNELDMDAYNLACCAFRSGDLLDVLNGEKLLDEESTWWMKGIAERLPAGYEYCDDFVGDTDSARALANADLVTIDIGLNDIMVPALMDVASSDSVIGTIIAGVFLGSMMGSTGDIAGSVVGKLSDIFSEAASDSEKAAELLDSIISLCDQSHIKNALAESEAIIKANYGPIVDKVQEISPNAEVAVVSFYNTYNTSIFTSVSMLTASAKLLRTVIANYKKLDAGEISAEELMAQLDDDAVNEVLYTIISTIMTLNYTETIKNINVDIKTMCNEKGATYVDITGIPVEKKLDPHPGVDGHAYIADKIVETLKKDVSVISCGATVKVNNAPCNRWNKYEVDFLSDLKFTVNPDCGYTVKCVKVNGKAVTPVKNVYTVENVKDDVTVVVETVKNIKPVKPVKPVRKFLPFWPFCW